MIVLNQVFSCPPRRFRQVGGGIGEMTSRTSSPGLRLEACPNQRSRLWRRTDGSARRLQRWRRFKHRTRSRRLHRRTQHRQSFSKTSNRRRSTRTGHVKSSRYDSVHRNENKTPLGTPYTWYRSLKMAGFILKVYSTTEHNFFPKSTHSIFKTAFTS